MTRTYPALILIALLSAGCRTPEKTVSAPPPSPTTAVEPGHEGHDHADHEGHDHGGDAAHDGHAFSGEAPRTGEMPHTGSGKLSPTPALDARIAMLEGEKKKDGESLAKLYAVRGARRMNDEAAMPAIKYPAALKDFRTALKYDPSNQMAKEGRDMLEMVYRSLKKPAPE